MTNPSIWEEKCRPSFLVLTDHRSAKQASSHFAPPILLLPYIQGPVSGNSTSIFFWENSFPLSQFQGSGWMWPLSWIKEWVYDQVWPSRAPYLLAPWFVQSWTCRLPESMKWNFMILSGIVLGGFLPPQKETQLGLELLYKEVAPEEEAGCWRHRLNLEMPLTEPRRPLYCLCQL